MRIRYLVAALALVGTISPSSARAQGAATSASVHAEDVGRFWQAYDAIRATTDPVRKRALLQTLYIDPGTPGLRALMVARRYTAQQYLDAIAAWPKFWDSVRPLTHRAAAAATPLAGDLAKLRLLYPALKPASITYAIGVLRTGGTTEGNQVLIGAELALGDETVNVSELPEPLRTRLGAYFKTRPFTNNGQNNIHEYIHTQQRESAPSLAARIVYEGVAEFVAEAVTGARPPLELYKFGPGHRAEIRDAFRKAMDGEDWSAWLYNSAASSPFGIGDLGYFVGYEIARGFYDRSADKAVAIRDMIELPYDDEAAVRAFIARSGYLAQ